MWRSWAGAFLSDIFCPSVVVFECFSFCYQPLSAYEDVVRVIAAMPARASAWVRLELRLTTTCDPFGSAKEEEEIRGVLNAMIDNIVKLNAMPRGTGVSRMVARSPLSLDESVCCRVRHGANKHMHWRLTFCVATIADAVNPITRSCVQGQGHSCRRLLSHRRRLSRLLRRRAVSGV